MRLYGLMQHPNGFVKRTHNRRLSIVKSEKKESVLVQFARVIEIKKSDPYINPSSNQIIKRKLGIHVLYTDILLSKKTIGDLIGTLYWYHKTFIEPDVAAS